MRFSVQVIAHNGAIHCGQVYPNLMRASRFQPQAKERSGFRFPLHPIMSDGVFPVRPDFALHPLPRFSNRQVDHAFCLGQMPFTNRQVFTDKRIRVQLPLQKLLGVRVVCYSKQAAGAFVQAIYRPKQIMVRAI